MTIFNSKDLSGAPLDWAVAKALNIPVCIILPNDYPHIIRLTSTGENWHPSSCPNQGQPLIEEYGIGTLFDAGSACRPLAWFATPDDQSVSTSYEGQGFDPAFMVDEGVGVYGSTQLIAALRCLVIKRLGHKVDIPEELT